MSERRKVSRSRITPLQSEVPWGPRLPSGTKLTPDLRAVVCRASSSPTCATSPGPSGRPGNRRADGTVSRIPRPVADPTPTATAPSAGQPLQEHTPPAPRNPPIHVRSNEGRGRIPHALCKAQSTPPDKRSALTGGSSGPAESATRSGTDPDTATPVGPVSSTPDPPRGCSRSGMEYCNVRSGPCPRPRLSLLELRYGRDRGLQGVRGGPQMRHFGNSVSRCVRAKHRMRSQEPEQEDGYGMVAGSWAVGPWAWNGWDVLVLAVLRPCEGMLRSSVRRRRCPQTAACSSGGRRRRGFPW